MLKTGRSDKSESVGIISSCYGGCYTAACSACWLGYDHTKDVHARDIAQHEANADEFSTRAYFQDNPTHYQPHGRTCGCGYIPKGEQGAAAKAAS